MIRLLLILLLLPTVADAWELPKIYTPADVEFGMEWTPATNAEGYEVERSIDGAYFTHWIDVIEPCFETSIGDNHRVRFRVRGYLMRNGERVIGEYSDSSAMIYGVSAPEVPKGLTVTIGM